VAGPAGASESETVVVVGAAVVVAVVVVVAMRTEAAVAEVNVVLAREFHVDYGVNHSSCPFMPKLNRLS